jgi:hypothetical protein
MKYYRYPEITKYPNSNLEIIKEIKEITKIYLRVQLILEKEVSLSHTHTHFERSVMMNGIYHIGFLEQLQPIMSIIKCLLFMAKISTWILSFIGDQIL